MTGEGLEWSHSIAIGYIYFTVTGATRYQKTGSVGEVFHEAHVSNGTIVHGQLCLSSFKLIRNWIKSHHFYGFIVRTGGQQISGSIPGKTAFNSEIK